MQTLSEPLRLFPQPKDIQKKVKKARLCIVQALGARALPTVTGERSNPFRMYQKLEQRYATKSPASRVRLLTRLHQMAYDVSKTMGEYVDELEDIFTKLGALDCPVTESLQVAILLSGFGNVDDSPYGPVVSALQTLADETLTWDTATSRLLEEYSSRNEASLSSPAKNTKVKSEPRALKSLARVKCYNCNKYGHYARHCREPNRGKKHQSRTDERRVQFDPNNREDVQQALMARSGGATSTELIVDSGATSYIIGNRALIRNNSTMPQVMISLGDGRRVRSNETGDVYISVVQRHLGDSNPLGSIKIRTENH